MGFLEKFKDLKNIFQTKSLRRTSATGQVGLGIDIGSGFLKIVEVKQVGGVLELSTYGEVAMGPYEDKVIGETTSLSDEQLKSSLETALKDARVTAKNATVAISSNESLVFTLKLPQVSRNDLKSVVPNEARKFVPVPITEVSLDWWRVPDIIQKESERSDTEDDVLVVAIKNQIIDQYNSIFSNTVGGVDIGSVEVETFSALRGVMNNELSPFMLVDFGARSVRIAVVEYGIVKTFHIINRGGAFITGALVKAFGLDFTAAEQMKREMNIADKNQETEIVQTNLQYIFTQIKKTLIDYERVNNSAINKVILIGGGSLLNGFRERLTSEINVEVFSSDPFAKVSTPDFLHDVLKQSGPEFAIAMGAALRNFES